jgi:hypothetical protein
VRLVGVRPTLRSIGFRGTTNQKFSVALFWHRTPSLNIWQPYNVEPPASTHHLGSPDMAYSGISRETCLATSSSMSPLSQRDAAPTQDDDDLMASMHRTRSFASIIPAWHKTVFKKTVEFGSLLNRRRSSVRGWCC